MSKIRKSPDRVYKISGEHQKYLERIKKTLYYGKLPKTDGLSLPVTELATEIFSEPHQKTSLNRLHLNDAAKISRIACVPPCSMVFALLYLERLKNCNPDYVEKTNPSDLFLISLMVSCKFLYDDGECDEVFIDEWATASGLTIPEIIRLERNFLQAINWEVYVKEASFWKKLQELELLVASREGNLRGHFTYTELTGLINTIELSNLLQCLVSVSAILTATYTMGLLTLVGSVFLTSQIPGTSLYVNKLNCNENVIENNMVEYENISSMDYSIDSIILNCLNVNLTDATSNENSDKITWDYWNVPIMKWLTDSTQTTTNYQDNIHTNYYLKNSFSHNQHFKFDHNVYYKDIRDKMKITCLEKWTDKHDSGLYFLYDSLMYF